MPIVHELGERMPHTVKSKGAAAKRQVAGGKKHHYPVGGKAAIGAKVTPLSGKLRGLKALHHRTRLKGPRSSGLSGQALQMKGFWHSGAGTATAVHHGKMIIRRQHETTKAMVSVSEVRKLAGVSQEDMGRITGYSTRSVAGWEAGRLLSDSARQKLTETKRLFDALAEIMPPEHLGEWLRTPNEAFEGQPPIQIVERGESDRLWQMIHQIDANVAN